MKFNYISENVAAEADFNFNYFLYVIKKVKHNISSGNIVPLVSHDTRGLLEKEFLAMRYRIVDDSKTSQPD